MINKAVHLTQTSQLLGNKLLTGFSFQKQTTKYLSLSLCLTGMDVNKPNTKFRGYVDFFHHFPNGEVDCKRFELTPDTFAESKIYTCFILSGDFVSRVSISLFYNLPSESEICLKQILSSMEYQDFRIPSSKSIMLKSIEQNKPIEFLRNLRALSPEKLYHLLSRELDALEVTINKAPEKDFYFWSISNQIIELVGEGRINTKFLNMVAERYSNEYASFKDSMNLSTENFA